MLSKDTIAQIDAFRTEFPSLFGIPPSSSDLALAEDTIEVRFSSSYRAFLTRYGSGVVGCFRVLGVGQDPRRRSTSTVVTETLRARQAGWPGPGWYVFTADLTGNPVAEHALNGQVWRYNHDCGTYDLLGHSLDHFLSKSLAEDLAPLLFQETPP